jgi:Type II secretion system (T2SS), protein K
MNPRARHSSGYVLLLAVLVVALLSLVLLTVARAQSGLSPALRQQSEEAERARAAHGLAARVAFLLLTEPIGPRSILVGGQAGETMAMEGTRSASGARLRELYLDGRSYALGEALVSLQDESGLLNLNSQDEAALAGLLREVGVRGAQAARLAAALSDYVDEDDLTRPGGAEGEVYRRAARGGPPNQAIASRWAALGVLGWEDLDEDARDALWRLTSTAPATGLNLNTAPAPVLRAVLGERAETLLGQIRQGPLQSVEALTGARTDAAGVVLAVQPGRVFRLVVAFAEAVGSREVESQLLLAAPGADRPFYWREARPERARGARMDAAEPLPQSAALDAP